EPRGQGLGPSSRPVAARPPPRRRVEEADLPVPLALAARREEQPGEERTELAGVAEGERPEARDREHVVSVVPQQAGKEPRRQLVSRDLSAAELSDEEVVREGAEVVRCEGQPPWRVQPGSPLHPLQQQAAERE